MAQKPGVTPPKVLQTQKQNQKDILKYFEEFGYHVTDAVKYAGISRRKYYEMLETYPEFDKAVKKALKLKRQRMFELFEDGLETLLEEKNMAALNLYAKCKGNKHGYNYTPSTIIQQNFDPIKIEIIEQNESDYTE